jgi:phenylpyruvate tautomerase PptA (4-oxalocrotonate tautomerase family)
MPTYFCSLDEGLADDSQKDAIAEAVTRIHSEETDAPAYFVQVVIEEKKPDTRYLGGSRATRPIIWIRGDIRAGRTDTQRAAMMLRIMHEVGRITGVEDQDIWVYLCNLDPTDMVEYGHVLPKPGEEAAWYENLPKSLQEYLQGLGTTRENFTL